MASDPSLLLTPYTSLSFSVLAPKTERLDRFLADQLALSRRDDVRAGSGETIRIVGAARLVHAAPV